MSSKMVLFSDKIYKLCEEKKLYQKQLATALSIDTPMYCRIERGERRAKKVLELADKSLTNEYQEYA